MRRRRFERRSVVESEGGASGRLLRASSATLASSHLPRLVNALLVRFRPALGPETSRSRAAPLGCAPAQPRRHSSPSLAQHAAKAAAGLALLLSACIAPPAIFEREGLDLDEAQMLFPEDTERVEIAVGNADLLVGLFVPAGPQAPVVLHLLESGGSIADPAMDYAGLASQLQDLGCASLFADYRGLGASSGARSVENLAEDAQALYAEALRRAHGDASRVAVRATSLGTVAAGELLASGLRPAALVLITPVPGPKVVPRFARQVYGWPGWLAAQLLFAPLSEVDAAEQLSALLGQPLLVVRPAEEPLASEAWLETLAHNTALAGGSFLSLPGSHFRVALQAHELLVDAELDLWCRFAARTTPLDDAQRETLRVQWALAPLDSFDPELRALLLDRSDPAGRLPLELLEALSTPRNIALRLAGLTRLFDAEQVADLVREAARGADCAWYTKVSVGQGIDVRFDIDPLQLIQQLCDRGIEPRDAQRWLARCLLKANRIPDRLRRDEAGALLLEAFERDQWTTLDLDAANLQKPATLLRFQGSLPLSGN